MAFASPIGDEEEDELGSPSAVDLERRPDPPEIDHVDEAGFESFPASDPPAIHIERHSERAIGQRSVRAC